MEQFLSLLFTWNQQAAYDEIVKIYQHKHSCMVDYMYFANLYSKKLFEQHTAQYMLSSFQDMLLDGYKKMNKTQICTVYQDAVSHADVLLPDGIALQVYYFLAKKYWLTNLNGTDFAPYVLDSLAQQFGRDKLRLVLYGTYPHLLQKTKEFLQAKWYQVVYAQDGYSNLDWNQVSLTLPPLDWCVNVLLVARATADYPIQEIWSYANMDRIHSLRLLVMNQAGTFDRWVGEQKRPPKIIRILRLEWFWRFILDPKRNYKKVIASLGIVHYIFAYLLLKKPTR